MAGEAGVPHFSVVIPTRHRNEDLARCLERLAPGRQSLASDRYDVLVTDDGSASTAREMITQRFPWARWCEGPRRGPAANRNSGAKQVSSPWIVFTDDDCEPSSGWLQAYSDAIERDSARPHDIYEGRTTCAAGIRSPVEHAPINETGGWLWSCNMAIQRESFVRLGGFDEEFPFAHMEDVDFRERARGLRLTEQFAPAATVDHPPRRVNLGEPLAVTHESEFMFFFKAGFRRQFRLRHIRRIANDRIRKYLRFREHPEAIELLRSLWVEARHIWRHGSAWERKYRTRYEGVSIPYLPDLAKRFHYRL